jgi:hypothetical protein
LAKQPGRRTCASLEVLVRRPLDGRHSVWRRPSGWGSSMRRAGPWTLPRRCTADRPGPAPAVWTGRDEPRPVHRAHRHHFSESGQITCQTKPDNSLVNNNLRKAPRQRRPAGARPLACRAAIRLLWGGGRTPGPP